MHNCKGKLSAVQKIEMEQMDTNVTIAVKLTVATVSINLSVSCTFLIQTIGMLYGGKFFLC